MDNKGLVVVAVILLGLSIFNIVKKKNNRIFIALPNFIKIVLGLSLIILNIIAKSFNQGYLGFFVANLLWVYFASGYVMQGLEEKYIYYFNGMSIMLRKYKIDDIKEVSIRCQGDYFTVDCQGRGLVVTQNYKMDDLAKVRSILSGLIK